MAIFTGAGVALITPMKEDLSVDYELPGQVLIAQTKPFISPGSRRESEATGF